MSVFFKNYTVKINIYILEDHNKVKRLAMYSESVVVGADPLSNPSSYLSLSPLKICTMVSVMESITSW